MTKVAKVAIVGAGGFAREVLDVYEAIDLEFPGAMFKVLGWIVEDAEPGTVIGDLPVLGGADWRRAHPDVAAVIGIGSPAIRRRLDAELGPPWERAVHPNAIVTRRVDIGEGTVITAGVILTTNIRLGRHVHLNLGATVGHDAVIGDFVTVSPGVHVSGRVTIEEDAFIGTGAVILEGLTVGHGAVVGAGAVVVRDVAPGTTVVGVPARPRDAA